MSVKSLIYSLLPLKMRVQIFKRYRMNTSCGYGETFNTYLQEAFKSYLSDDEYKDSVLKAILTDDIIGSWLRYKALPYEYFLFGYRGKSHAQRAAFLTDWERLPILYRMNRSEEFLHDINDKYNFYNKMKSYFGRNAYCVDKESSVEDFINFAIVYKDLFAKLLSSSKGRGAISRRVDTEDDARSFYHELLEKGESWIVEEKVQQSSQMAAWCSSCVNTVRIPSFKTSDGFYVLDPFFRTGREGSIVDNAYQGGVFAVIDLKTGLLITDGLDEKGKEYTQHPDSNKVFKGWQIPYWNELLDVVKQAHMQFPNQKYIGWDFALNKDNKWVLIEGNWGQMIGQYATKKGIKKEFLNYLTE